VEAQAVVRVPTRTVVVADETAFVRDRFRGALTGAGHRVLLAGSRADLLALVRKAGDTIDMIVLDVRLSGSDASSLVRKLRKLLPHSPGIVGFSGTVGDTAALRRLAALNVTAFINEYTSERNILRALQPFLAGDDTHRRVCPRVALGAAVTFRHGHTIVTAVTLNISRGGVAIRSTTPLPVGTSVRLRLRLPSPAKEIEADGRVVWSNPQSGMGLRFDRICGDHQDAIEEFVNSCFFSNRKR
jgi:uncharacterized protein (TIGR02266 family)